MPKYSITDISSPLFLKDLTVPEMKELASDIREFLIESISHTGGHLSSNLGVVELTIALHYVFNSPTDKIFFDVGHQSYVHKILTGRAKDFGTLRQFHGLSGFQKRKESIHDVWEAGHSSTALSAAVGMAFARDLNHQKYHVVPVIGDAAIVGGPSLEALNHLGASDTKVIMILNDNQMSISKNVGGFSEFLSDIRTSHAYNAAKGEYREILTKSKIGKSIYEISSKAKDLIKRRVIDSKIFGEFGVEYLGPINGHDFNELIRTLEKAKSMDESVVVHVLTTKGKGYEPAEKDTHGHWHGVEPFDKKTGEPLYPSAETTWSQFIADEVYRHMAADDDIVAITPAMIAGSKMEKIFHDFKDRAFDVGIAEAHATTFAAGLAISGKKPFISMYSSFLQRAYDQINHDIARMNLPVVIGIDRAGLVGADGETHHGIFDLGILKPIPNTIIFAPSSKQEASWFLDIAFKASHGLHCIRYAKQKARDYPFDQSKMAVGKWLYAYQAADPKAVLITYGEAVNECVLKIMEEQLPYHVVNACFLKPIDTEMIVELAELNLPIFVYERDLASCGLAKDIEDILIKKKCCLNINAYGLPDKFFQQGTLESLLKEEGLDLDNVFKEIAEVLHEERKN